MTERVYVGVATILRCDVDYLRLLDLPGIEYVWVKLVFCLAMVTAGAVCHLQTVW